MVQQDTSIRTETGSPQGQKACKPYGSIDSYGQLCSRAEAAYGAGRVDEAIRLYEEAIGGGLDRPMAYKTLGQLYLSVKQYEAAEKLFQHAARTMPISLELLDHWVWALLGQGRIDRARQVIEDALSGSSAQSLHPLAKALHGEDLESLKLVADTLFEAGQLGPAREYYEKAAAIQPTSFVFARLAHVCRFTGALSTAAEYLRKALDLEPDHAECLANLGDTLILLGRIEEGVALTRRAVERRPDSAKIHSNSLFAMHYLPHQDRKGSFEEHKRWGQRHAPLSLARRNHDNDPDPDRPLRIGYLSSDFKMHSVAYTFEAGLEARNRCGDLVFGYGSLLHPDAVTKRLRSKFDVYRDIRGLDDRAAAALIEQDRIDILVALAGHTADHRLPILAYKPSPIQVDAGSLATLGMEQMDYRLTDVLLDPPRDKDYYLEELVYLPGGCLCYRPPQFAPDVGSLPAIRTGGVTFGSFNGSQKIHPGVVSLWSAVLKAVEGARLVMKFTGGQEPVLAEHYLGLFEHCGVRRDRIRIYGWLSPEAHLNLYNQVDIALDTYPFNGCITTLEGLWMGVPTISLTGSAYISRVGRTVLTRVGMAGCVAESADGFIQKAVSMAGHVEVLARIRAGLRARVQSSPLCDARRYAQEVETAYRWMWRQWCEGQNTEARIQNSELRTLNSERSTQARGAR